MRPIMLLEIITTSMTMKSCQLWPRPHCQRQQARPRLFCLNCTLLTCIIQPRQLSTSRPRATRFLISWLCLAPPPRLRLQQLVSRLLAKCTLQPKAAFTLRRLPLLHQRQSHTRPPPQPRPQDLEVWQPCLANLAICKRKTTISTKP